MRKLFDKNLHAECDPPAKTTIFKLLEKTSFYAKESASRIAVDMEIYNRGIHICNLEVECKKVWKGESFPYDTVNIAQRKEKYAKLEKPTLFVMFNADFTNYLVIPSKILLESPQEIVRNKYVPYGEYFFKVDKTKISFNNLEEVLGKIL